MSTGQAAESSGSSAPFGGSRQRRRAESDRKMLRAALSLISRHGTVGASMAQIGVDAGYSRGLPVQRFGTKLSLLEAVVDAIQDRFLRQVERRTAGKKGLAALAERIRVQIEAVRDMPDSAIGLYHLIVDSTGILPELKPRVARLHEAYRDNLRMFLTQAEDLGELREGLDIEHYVRTISGTISGICIQALIVDGDIERLGEDAVFVADLFLAQIAREPRRLAPTSGAAHG